MEHLFADIIVVGGGHAGIEAAAAGHRMGLKVRLLSLHADKVGELSCNPAIGGTAGRPCACGRCARAACRQSGTTSVPARG